LVQQLLKMDYERRSQGVALAAGTFRAEGGDVEIFRRRFNTAEGLQGGDRLRVNLSGGVIANLEPLGGASLNLSVARLDPPLIASYYGPDLRERRPVVLDELPEDLILAVLAAEDAGFLEHRGVSFRGILRAAWVNFRAGEVEQGGSTLTQQLVKNLYLTHERRWERKLRELTLAVLLEYRYDKRSILQTYLNEIYWGRSGAVNLMGVGAAAWAYFGKSPVELTLGESALLAGMIHSPANLSPLAHPKAALERRDFVLGRLAQLSWVETTRLEKAAQETLKTRGRLVARRAPFFADWIEAEAARRYGVDSLRDTGFELHSTLSLEDQAKAEEALAWGLDSLEKGWEKGRGGASLEAALISLDPQTGGIRAWVGGRDYGRSQFDRVSQARRQAGSVFKPIVYATAFERKLATPASMLDDSSFTWTLAGRAWTPKNSDGKYRGLVTARAALEKSLNVPTARLARKAGLEHIVHMARRLGIGSHLDPYPSIALGAMEVTPVEMATVYATLASGGLRPTVHGLVAIFDRQGERVSGLAPSPPKRVISKELSFLVTDVLRGVLIRGTGRNARRDGLKDPLAGKTGTTNSRRDSWFAGYSPKRATLVWVGYDDNRKTRLSGARAALPIWARFMLKVRPAGGYPPFVRPARVVEALVDPLTGGLATTRCESLTKEIFLERAVPRLCPEHSGLWARPLEQPEGMETPERDHPFQRFLDRVRGRRQEGVKQR
jgi:penicillin-binding protein 1B